MNLYSAEIDIMPKKELLDPQGKAVENGLKNLAITTLSNIRIGKHISFQVQASNLDEAWDKAEDACKKLLANPVMETYEIVITEE